MDFEAGLLWFKSWLYYLIPLFIRGYCLTSVCFRFLVSNMENHESVYFVLLFVRNKWGNTCRCLELPGPW